MNEAMWRDLITRAYKCNEWAWDNCVCDEGRGAGLAREKGNNGSSEQGAILSLSTTTTTTKLRKQSMQTAVHYSVRTPHEHRITATDQLCLRSYLCNSIHLTYVWSHLMQTYKQMVLAVGSPLRSQFRP